MNDEQKPDEPTTPPAPTKRPIKPKVKTRPAEPKEPPAPAPVLSTRADEILEQFTREESTRATLKIEKDLREYQYYLQCHACAQPGIFFTCNPYGKLIVDTDWYSTYKDADELYIDRPHCQMCEKRGRHEALLMERVERRAMPGGMDRLHGWRVRGRWANNLMKMPRDPQERAKKPRQRAAPKNRTEPHLKPITYED